MKDEPIYSSQLIGPYIEYLEKYHKDVNIDSLLDYAGIKRYELEEKAHWFTQSQINLFHTKLAEVTNTPDISKKVGRFTVLSRASSVVRKFALGFLRPASAFKMLGEIAANLTRGHIIKTKQISSEKAEVVVTLKPGVKEKAFQCENRMGLFEATPTLFASKNAKVEHPLCMHRGDDCCRYLVSWEKPAFGFWKQVRNYSTLLGGLAALALVFLLPVHHSLSIIVGFAFLLMAISLYANFLENKDLTRTIQSQGDASKELLEEMSIRYNNALLIQEIGQATSRILETKKLTRTVVNLMKKRLDFDRGMIMLENKDKTRLVYSAGYGYDKKSEAFLKGVEFHLDNSSSKGIFVTSFKEKKPFLIDDIMEDGKELSKRSIELARQMNVSSIICVPIVYENECFGILAVDNVQSKRPLSSSDMNLLMGIAWQTAANIMEVKSFERLQESEKKYRDLVENANSIILRTDIKGNITFYNEFAEKFFGYSQQHILGKNIIGTILPETEKARLSFRDLVRTLRLRGKEGRSVVENEYVLSNGKTAWIAWTNKAIFDKDGQLSEILSIGNDLTEIRNLENQLRESQKMEAIGTLAGGIAHDFNNILQALLGYTQILKMREGLNAQSKSILDQIEKSGQRASELTQRLMIFSRKTESKLRPMDLTHEVQQVSKILERTIPKMIHIELNLADDIRVINADPVQIEQVLMNIAINARDAMPEGGKLLIETRNVVLDEAYCEKNLKASPGEYVLLNISDNGKGMDKEVVDHIFEPFFTTKETGKGTGLGLAMVYGIVESHGGHITCESQPSAGTTFSIYFPVANKDIEFSSIEETTRQLKGGNETVLLVDDEEGIRESIGEILSDFGYKTIFAKDGETALETYTKKNSEIDLILLDLVMPGIGGKQCLNRLIELDPQAKVIVSSGQYVDAVTRKEIESASKGFLSKPYETGQMLNLIREVLDGNK